jgi:hypothetical protein
MQIIKQNINIWHIKEIHFTLLWEINGLPTTVVMTIVSQEQALYRLLHSCGKYLNNQALTKEAMRDGYFEYLVYCCVD